MPNYKESNVSGTSWQRAYMVQINNPYQQIPSIDFFEEEIISVGDKTIAHYTGEIKENFDDPSVTFDLINPIDGTVIGQSNYQQVYVILSSLYMALAAKRDQQLAA